MDLDDPRRCPWCHVTWAVIISSGWHTCEKMRSWRHHAKEKVKLAQIMRQEAQEGRCEAAWALGRDYHPPAPPRRRAVPSRPSDEVPD